MPTSRKSVAILGAGSWGTALAITAARAHHEKNVLLWDHDPEHCEKIQKTRENKRYLPGITLPENLTATSNLEGAIETSTEILICVPSHAFRSIIKSLKLTDLPLPGITWATKGLEPQTGFLMHQIVYDELDHDISMAVLSGPTFAKEVAQGLPTAITLASNSEHYAQTITSVLHSQFFRVYQSRDVIGVELGGSIKNVLAIATGISDGLGFSANTRAALITRGLNEMLQIGMAEGGEQKTFMGLAGLGDLVLTCTDNQSRNRRFGLALAQGTSPDEAIKQIGQAVEGYQTAKEIYHLAKKHQLNVPIIEHIHLVLHEDMSPQKAVDNLLSRAPKAE